MERTSILRFGATAAFLVGALQVLAGVTHFLLPSDQLRGATGVDAAFFISLAASSTVFVVHYWLIVLGCLFNLGVTVALFTLMRGHRSGFFRWATLLGVVGLALAAADYALVGVESPRIAARFATAPTAAQAALLLQGVPHVDPCFFGWGLMGLWWLGANVAALRAGRLPRLLASLGILGGLLTLGGFAGALVRSALVVDIAVGLGFLVVAPVWSFWFGWTLRREVVRERGT
ncbi:MAG: DUF4386 family protein [Anaerolineae bacterium]|jgi:hypothetical protein